MKNIEDKLAALLMDYGVLKNADADKMARNIAGMFEKERAQLAAKCAEMRGALTEILSVVELLDYDETRYWTNLITHALSDSCGTGWLSPEKAAKMRAMLQEVYEWCVTDNPSDIDGDTVKRVLDETK